MAEEVEQGSREGWRDALAPAISLGSIMSCVELARVSRDALFITTVGAQQIPMTYIAVAAVMFALSAVYAATVRRIGVYNLLRIYLSLCGFFLVIMWIALETRALPRIPVTYMIFCGVEAFFIFLPMAFWALMNERYTPGQGARIFPIVGAGGVLGVVLGGTMPRILERALPPVALLMIASFLIVPALVACRIISRRATSIVCLEEDSQAQKASLWNQPLVRTLTYLALPMWILAYIIEFTYYEALGRVFTDDTDLAGFLGLVVSVASVCGLLVQMFITPFLLRSLGVGTTAVVYPLFLAVGGILVLVYSLFPEATSRTADLGGVVGLVLLSRLFDLALYYSVQESSLHLLFYAITPRQRARARALISGTIFPLSIALAGGLLLMFRSTGQPVYSIAFAGASIGFLLLVVALNIAPDYLRARLATTSESDEKERVGLLDELSGLPSSETRYVFLDSITSKNLAEAVFAADQLSMMADEELIEDLLEIVEGIHPAAIDRLLAQIPRSVIGTSEAELRRLGGIAESAVGVREGTTL